MYIYIYRSLFKCRYEYISTYTYAYIYIYIHTRFIHFFLLLLVISGTCHWTVRGSGPTRSISVQAGTMRHGLGCLRTLSFGAVMWRLFQTRVPGRGLSHDIGVCVCISYLCSYVLFCSNFLWSCAMVFAHMCVYMYMYIYRHLS